MISSNYSYLISDLFAHSYIQVHMMTSAVDDLFNQWDTNTAIPMEDMWTAKRTMLKNKPHLIPFHESIFGQPTNFSAHSHSFKYSYVILIIYTQFFLSNDFPQKMHLALTGTTPGQSGPENNDNERLTSHSSGILI